MIEVADLCALSLKKVYKLELKGHEDCTGSNRAAGTKHGADKHRPNWKEAREAEARDLGYTEQPYVVIIGGG